MEKLLLFVVEISCFFMLLFLLRKKPYPYYFYILNYFFLTTAVLAYLGVLTKSYAIYPHLSKVQSPLGYLIGPLSYFFVLLTLEPSRKFHWKDLLHLIPFLYHTIELIPYYTLSRSEKLTLIQHIDIYEIWENKQGLLFTYYNHAVLKVISLIVYAVFQSRVLYKFLLQASQTLLAYNKLLIRWLIYETALRYLLCLSLILVIFIAQFESPFFLSLVPGTLISINIVAAISLIFLHPEIMQGLQLVRMQFVAPANRSFNVVETNDDANEPMTNETNDRSPAENKERCKHIFKTIESYMQIKQPYLDDTFTRQRMADDLHLAPKKITETISLCAGLNFSDYVNTYRLEHIVIHIGNGSAKWKNFTIETIALEAGFGNRTSLHNAIKRMKNMTPTEFIQSLQESKA